MQANCWQFLLPCVVECGAHRPMEHIQGFPRNLWMLPLGKCLPRISLAAAMVDNFGCKQENTNKTQLSASKPMVDLSKKAKQFWDPKRTLYSHHPCNKLRTNVKHHDSSWRAQLHFELSNVVNKQKFERVMCVCWLGHWLERTFFAILGTFKPCCMDPPRLATWLLKLRVT